MNIHIARIISVIFHPVLIPTYGIIALLSMDYFYSYPQVYKMVAVSIVNLCTFFIPLSFLFIMYKIKIVDDMRIEKREQRHSIYFITLASYMLCVFLLWKIMMPYWFMMLAVCALLVILAVAIINFFWKISVHAATAGCFAGGTFLIAFLLKLNPWMFICIVLFMGALVMSARIKLKAHSLAQVVAGYVLGLGFMILLPVFFQMFSRFLM